MEKEISSEDILVGDILKLKFGDIIDVDGFVFGDTKVGMDESLVNGESDIMWKINNFELKRRRYFCPFVFSGSKVLEGYGYMIVAAVGENTYKAKNKELITANEEDEEEDEPDKTPLKKQLDDLSNLISSLGYLFAIIIGVVLFIKGTIINIINGISIFSFNELDV